MKMTFHTALALGASTLLLSGCAALSGGGGGGKDTKYVARDVNTLYTAAKERLDAGNYEVAAALFDEVERQHPYSPWARRAQLMSAFSYYMGQKYNESINSAKRFLSIHPGNKDAPYAYYLVALCYYEQISDVTRDQKITEQALSALGEVQRRYPNSRYAADAGLKIDLVNDHLAGKEVAEKFQTTTHTPEALYRLTESYLAMGVPAEAKKAAAVLGANYPGSKWYERAYELMQKHSPAS
jgi:outer membrane protein assembly factor BamD